MLIAVDRIEDHPENANRMNDALLGKLIAHLERSGHYPPLIVRPHPSQADRFQLIDGHHRLLALKRLGRPEANCEIWEVDDACVTELLLTLNRLHGEDDPFRRAALLGRLAASMPLEEMARRLPENAQRIRKLTALLDRPALAPPPPLVDLPQTVTFVMTARQRARLIDKLEAICKDRTRALLRLLKLDDAEPAQPQHANPADECGLENGSVA